MWFTHSRYQNSRAAYAPESPGGIARDDDHLLLRDCASKQAGGPVYQMVSRVSAVTILGVLIEPKSN
jgi:hypothetical protein